MDLDDFSKLGFNMGLNFIHCDGLGKATDEDLTFCVGLLDVDALLVDYDRL
jgi:hypothetical protein